MATRRSPEGDATGDAERANTTRTSMPKDDAFHLLQNSRRRAVLRHLVERDDEQFDMRAVAEAVAAWEHGTTVARLDADQRQRVYISLYQSHLPKLGDADVIDYDQDRGTIEPRAAIGLLEPYLDEGLRAGAELSRPAGPTSGEESGLAGAVLALLTR